jgi:hypothetical protein
VRGDVRVFGNGRMANKNKFAHDLSRTY